MRRPERVRVLVKPFKGYGFEVQEGALYLFHPKEIVILEDFMRRPRLRPQNSLTALM